MDTRDNRSFVQQGFCNWFWHEISSKFWQKLSCSSLSFLVILAGQTGQPLDLHPSSKDHLIFYAHAKREGGNSERFHCYCFLTETKWHGRSWHNATVMDGWMGRVFHCSDWGPRLRQLQLWGINTFPSTPAFIPGRLSWHILILQTVLEQHLYNELCSVITSILF